MDRFFISGCQRSGTALLRLILESHPYMQCLDEVVGYDVLTHSQEDESSEFVVKKGASLIGFKIPRFAEQWTRVDFSDPDYVRFSKGIAVGETDSRLPIITQLIAEHRNFISEMPIHE